MKDRIAGLAAHFAFVLMFGWAVAAAAEPVTLQCDPAQTTAKFTLGDVLHTVHGNFKVKGCELHFDAASSKVDGAIVFDATSGQSGSDGRDHKMHKEVLESARYPEIAFHPDRVDGNVSSTGTSTIRVHGLFEIHGAAHEMTAPVEVKFDNQRWSATAHFPVPYTKWGMKNPSVFLLRVGDTVDIELLAAGALKPGSP